MKDPLGFISRQEHALAVKHRRLAPLASLIVLLLAGAACGSDDSTAPIIATATFAPALNIDLASMTQTASGLYFRDSIVGTGTAASSRDSIRATYTGWLANGTRFDGGSISFGLGKGSVIPGWDEGIVSMRVGGWRKLVIPPSLAYGKAGSGPIPGNSILVFNVQLVSVFK